MESVREKFDGDVYSFKLNVEFVLMIAQFRFSAFLLFCLATAQVNAVDFSHDVVPILKKHCVACHGGEKAKGKFSLNTRALLLDAKAAVAGNASKSTMIALIESKDTEEQMPPKGKTRVSAKEVATLKAWVNEGLKWESGFSFAPKGYEPPLRPRKIKLPPAIAGRSHPIDRIIDAYQAKNKVVRPKPLDDAGFMRRSYLDIIGLPPLPDELAKFVTDTKTNKREVLIRSLLARDFEYAEHWMTFWNDLLRNAYFGTGFIDGGRKQITGWLYKSLLINKPYDQFVRELIAPTAESEGFIRGIKWRGDVNASQTSEIQFSQSISQVFLGINMKCASCHDSFIDRWTLKEAYGLAAIYSTKELEIFRCDKPTGKKAAAAWIFPELGKINPAASQPERLKQLAKLMTDPQNGRTSRTIVNRLWDKLMGRGIVHPTDAMHTKPWDGDLLDYLANYLVEQKYDMKKVIEHIASSKAYQSRAVVMDAVPASDRYKFTGPVVKRLTAEQYLDGIRSITGVWPKVDGRSFKGAGRSQGGQLGSVLKAHGPKAQWGDRHVRSVFARLDSLQATLGRPNREQIVTSRPDQLTTLEAINLANGQAISDLLKKGQANIAARKFRSKRELITWLYQYALSRAPTRKEAFTASVILGPSATPSAEGVEDLLWTIFMLPEFQFVR